MKQEQLYSDSLTLLTDLYQLTMAQAYWKSGMVHTEAVFHLTFRKNPFGGGFAIACGLHTAIERIQAFHFSSTDIEYLLSLHGNDGRSLFSKDFLEYLERDRFSCDIAAVREGTVVFPNEPIIRVKGPIIQCQLLETTLLNAINFETLIATKAARICYAAQGDPVIDFGLRRAQGADGSVSAARAAYVGGCSGTSNVLAGKLHAIPVKGTHAHSWVMSYEDELVALNAYANASPNNCLLLVDTYDTVEGITKAITVAKNLKKMGHKFLGIRLDSGDLTHLSIVARERLNNAGFHDAKIVASNDLDEYKIAQLKDAGAKIDVWGVGTRLITAYDQPALGGVYKLSAIKKLGDHWEYKMKLSNDHIKISNPGILNIRRIGRPGYNPLGDLIFDIDTKCTPYTGLDELGLSKDQMYINDMLLMGIFIDGELVYNKPSLEDVRVKARLNIESFPEEIRRIEDPDIYPVKLESRLANIKSEMITKLVTRRQ